jgi:hypothetical protein
LIDYKDIILFKYYKKLKKKAGFHLFLNAKKANLSPNLEEKVHDKAKKRNFSRLNCLKKHWLRQEK